MKLAFDTLYNYTCSTQFIETVHCVNSLILKVRCIIYIDI